MVNRKQIVLLRSEFRFVRDEQASEVEEGAKPPERPNLGLCRQLESGRFAEWWLMGLESAEKSIDLRLLRRS